MTPQVQVLEELTCVAPLGVRFWDVAAMSPAGDGLFLTAYPDAFPYLRSTAFVNRTSVYFFRNLPGLNRVEAGSGLEDFWAANPPRVRFTIEVSDPEERYLPYQFPALLPVHGLFGLVGSPLSDSLTPDATWLPIFSDPARELPGPSVVIRAQLFDVVANAPAAWALVAAQIPGAGVMTGLTDARGVVSLTLPYPEPRSTPFASPLGPGSLRLSDQTWPVTVTIFYSHQSIGESLPDLETILQQGPATAWRDTTRSAQAGSFIVQFGKELILRSFDAAGGRDLPVLLVTPASSPL